MVIMTTRASIFNFASGSSVLVTSSASTQTKANVGEASPAHGAAAICLNGVSLEATFRLEPGGLRVVVRGFDDADPDGTRVSDKLLLKPGERRVIRMRRSYGGPPAHFAITRIGDGVQISGEGQPW
jgi:hypothetical protein